MLVDVFDTTANSTNFTALASSRVPRRNQDHSRTGGPSASACGRGGFAESAAARLARHRLSVPLSVMLPTTTRLLALERTRAIPSSVTSLAFGQ